MGTPAKLPKESYIRPLLDTPLDDLRGTSNDPMFGTLFGLIPAMFAWPFFPISVALGTTLMIVCLLAYFIVVLPVTWRFYGIIETVQDQRAENKKIARFNRAIRNLGSKERKMIAPIQNKTAFFQALYDDPEGFFEKRDQHLNDPSRALRRATYSLRYSRDVQSIVEDYIALEAEGWIEQERLGAFTEESADAKDLSGAANFLDSARAEVDALDAVQDVEQLLGQSAGEA